MKKLLILLICGFAFTQSIQTRQIEFTTVEGGDFWNPESFNIPDILDDEFYTLELIAIKDTPECYSIWGDIPVYIWWYEEASFICMDDGPNIIVNRGMSLTDINDACVNYGFDNVNVWHDNPMTIMKPAGNNATLNIETTGCSDGNPFTATYVFHITGLFEDEGVGLEGDLNDDDIVNVVDIVAIVNIILGTEE